LPRVSHQSGNIKPETIRLSIAAGGAYYGNDVAISDAELSSRLQVASANNPQPELHFRGDKDVRCEPVALAMPSAKKSGLRKIGFVTEPQPWLNAMPVNATSIKGAPPAPRSEL
jgi:biopolymer transport protein ExbD